MCEYVDKKLETIRKYKDVIIMFIGIIAASYIYSDFKEVVKLQSETSAQTAEILRTIDTRLQHLEDYHSQSK